MDMDCLRCNTKMKYLMREKIQLGKTGWILGDIPNLISGALELDIYVCPTCRKTEFFAAEDQHVEQTEDLPQRVCPDCGREHDFDYPKCPFCGNNYFGNE